MPWRSRARRARSGILTFITVRLLSLDTVLVIGFLLLMSFAVSVAIAAVVTHAEHWIAVPPLLIAALDTTLSLLVTTVLFGMLFRILPDVQLAWADVWRGALFTAVLFVLGQYLISIYLTRVLVLFWVYYSSLILFFGTALTRVAIEHRDGAVTPKTTAVLDTPR